MGSTEDPLDARPRCLETQPGEDPGNSPRAPGGPFGLEMVRNLLNQVGQSIHGLPGLDKLLEPAGGVLSPVGERLDRNKERSGCRSRRKRVTRRVKQNLEPLPGFESGTFPGRKAQEPGSQDLVFTLKLRQLLVEKVDLGGQ